MALMALTNYKLSMFIMFLIVLPLSAHAKIADFDEYLQKKAADSYEQSLNSFNPNPEGVTDDFNQLVGKTLAGENNKTRRNLINVAGCRATNPIDRCWRCDPNWETNRKKLAECAAGFGYRTTGGKDGDFYIVTDASDNNVAEPIPGTLRHAVIQNRPLWIVFANNMVIKLQQELIITSNKTIDGRGAQVHIAFGAGLTLQFVQNVIINNIWIHDIVPASGGMIRDAADHLGLRTQSDGDAITVFSSSNVWIDHVSLSKASDGLIDVIEGSTAVTISNCQFNHHNDVMLLGAHEESSIDAIMQVTVAFNRFGVGLIQRMPRCRWGFVHVVNNDYFHWELYAIGGSAHPTIISQGNRFTASDYRYTKEVTKRDYAAESEWMKWQWRSEGDLFTNGAYFRESGPPLKHENSPLIGESLIKFRPGTFVGRLTRNAGALRCRRGVPC